MVNPGYNSRELKDNDFNTIRKMFYEGSGIKLTDQKAVMVASRLTKRLRQLRLPNYKEYMRYLKSNPDEYNNLLNLLTTNVTQFFREPHHFKFLQYEFLPEFIASNSARTFRVWSAGCSSGQEPYTIAIVLNEFFEKHGGWDFRILASDINTEVLDKAAEGIYKTEEIEDIPDHLLKKYFKKGVGSNAGLFKVKDELRKKIIFKMINLNDAAPDYPIKGTLDLIFCRNVFIYFDNEHKNAAIKKYYKKLNTGGCLFIGHSESLNPGEKNIGNWKLIKHTVYRKED